VAADVFIYIGALEELFREAYCCLSSSKEHPGLLVFTVEELPEIFGVTSSSIGSGVISSPPADQLLRVDGEDDNSFSIGSIANEEDKSLDTMISSALRPGVRLLACGRFGHSEAYIRTLADRTGFTVLSAKRDILRTQTEKPVSSITFVLDKQ
jgi:predicted TPR repeat methyltransferase